MDRYAADQQIRVRLYSCIISDIVYILYSESQITLIVVIDELWSLRL